MNGDTRIRINSKQTAKGEWYFDITAETGDIESSANKLIAAVKAAEERFIADGRKVAGQEASKEVR